MPFEELQKSMANVLARDAQESKMRSWPHGASGEGYSPNVTSLFIGDFYETRVLNGTDRFSLYRLLKHDCEMQVLGNQELNEAFYKEFPGIAGNPAMDALSRLQTTHFVEPMPMGAVKLSEPYYSRYKGQPFMPPPPWRR